MRASQIPKPPPPPPKPPPKKVYHRVPRVPKTKWGDYRQMKALAEELMEWELDHTELCSESRKPHNVVGREIIAAFLYYLGDRSLPEIAIDFGGKSHTTFLAASRRIVSKIMARMTDEEWKSVIEERIEELHQRKKVNGG